MCAWLSGVDLRKVTRGSSARRPPNDGLKVDNDGCSHQVPRVATTWIFPPFCFSIVLPFGSYSNSCRNTFFWCACASDAVYIIVCVSLVNSDACRWCVEAAAGGGCPSGQDGSLSRVIGENLMMMKRRLHPSETLKGRKTVYQLFLVGVEAVTSYGNKTCRGGVGAEKG